MQGVVYCQEMLSCASAVIPAMSVVVNCAASGLLEYKADKEIFV